MLSAARAEREILTQFWQRQIFLIFFLILQTRILLQNFSALCEAPMRDSYVSIALACSLTTRGPYSQKETSNPSSEVQYPAPSGQPLPNPPEYKYNPPLVFRGQVEKIKYILPKQGTSLAFLGAHQHAKSLPKSDHTISQSQVSVQLRSSTRYLAKSC